MSIQKPLNKKSQYRSFFTILFICTLMAFLSSCGNFFFKRNSQQLSEFTADSTYKTGSEKKSSDPFQTSKNNPWDLINTKLNLRVNFDSQSIDGSAIIDAKPHFYSQDSLVLDAKNLDIFTVQQFFESKKQPESNAITQQTNKTTTTIHKAQLPETQNLQPAPENLRFRYTDNAHLVVYFSSTQIPEAPISIEIQYQATPSKKKKSLSIQSKDDLFQAIENDISGSAISDDIGLYFINNDLKNPLKPRQLWTQGEPESNCHWFPTIDAPNQKHTQTISITYPDTMVSLSNGKLIKSIKLSGNTTKNGLKTDVWQQDKPHAPYLTMLALGNWSVVRDSVMWPIDPFSKKSEKLPIEYLVEPQYASFAPKIFGNTPEMIRFFSDFTGVRFPWDKYSQVVVRDFVSGAMENTSATVHQEALAHDSFAHLDDTYEDYISHELFHQWFGNYVTAENWSDLTLNESFATYGEYLWREHKYGKNNAFAWLLNCEAPIYQTGRNSQNPLLRYQYQNPNEQFDLIRYQFGACVLHLLRHFIGDEAFKASMKIYLESHKFGTAEVADWRLAIESVTHIDMKTFFEKWYTKPYDFTNPPTIELQWPSIYSPRPTEGDSTPISPNYTLIHSPKSKGFQSIASREILRYNLNNEIQEKTILNNWNSPIEISFGSEQATHVYLNPNDYLPLVTYQYQSPLEISALTVISFKLNRMRELLLDIQRECPAPYDSRAQNQLPKLNINEIFCYNIAIELKLLMDELEVLLETQIAIPTKSKQQILDQGTLQKALANEIHTARNTLSYHLIASGSEPLIQEGVLSCLMRLAVAEGQSQNNENTNIVSENSIIALILQQQQNTKLSNTIRTWLFEMLYTFETSHQTKSDTNILNALWNGRHCNSPLLQSRILEYVGSRQPLSGANYYFGGNPRTEFVNWESEMYGLPHSWQQLNWAKQLISLSSVIQFADKNSVVNSKLSDSTLTNMAKKFANNLHLNLNDWVQLLNHISEVYDATEVNTSIIMNNPKWDHLLNPFWETAISNNNQTLISALRFTTQKEWEEMNTLIKVAKDLGKNELSNDDWSSNGWSKIQIQTLNNIHSGVRVGN